MSIHLTDDCFAAWRSAKEAGLEENGENKVNYGVLVLQALLDHWPKAHQRSDDGENIIYMEIKLKIRFHNFMLPNVLAYKNGLFTLNSSLT